MSELPEALWSGLRRALIAIASDGGVAEGPEAPPDPRQILLTSRFKKALAKDNFLVLGDRGAGKTLLFRALAARGGEPWLDESRQTRVGFARRSEGPPLPGPDSLAVALDGADLARHRLLWLGLLGRSLRADLDVLGPGLGQALDEPDPATLIEGLTRHVAELEGALVALDRRLVERREDLLLLYDDLDQIVPTWEGLGPSLRGLFSLWQTGSRAWRRIKPKIFLRRDLFDHQMLSFPDGAKFFAARMVVLSWGREDLFALVVKRLLNRDPLNDPDGPRLMAWLTALCGGEDNLRRDPVRGIDLKDRLPLGPRLLEALVGQDRGPEPWGGDPEAWVMGHITDTLGEASPRSLLRLLRGAAEQAEDMFQPLTCVPWPAFVETQRKVSELRLQELRDEDEWVDALRDALTQARTPMAREHLEARLKPLVGLPRVPCKTPGELADRLAKRGLFSLRSDGRFDVPELYRAALGLLREEAPEPLRQLPPGLEVEEQVNQLFCGPEAPYGPYTRSARQPIETLLPGVLYRVRLIDRDSQPVTLQLYRQLDDVGGALWQREARALMRLSSRGHSALPRVRDGGYIDEEDLAYVLSEAATYTLAEPGAMDLIGQDAPEGLRQFVMLAQGVARLHEQGVIHRNIHPGTVEYLGDDDGFSLRLSRFEMSTMLSNLLRGPQDAHERRLRDLLRAELERWLPYSPPERLEWLLNEPASDIDLVDSDREDIYPLGVMALRWLVGPHAGAELHEVWEPGPPGLDRAHALRSALLHALERSGLPGELRRLLRDMLNERPEDRPAISEVLQRLSERYGALSLALSKATGQGTYHVGFMPEESHKTLIPWGWISKDPNEPEGREELRRFLEHELEGAELLHAPGGFATFRQALNEKEREAFKSAQHVLRGRQAYWFCDLYIPPGPGFSADRIRIEELMLIKYVRHRRRAWRLDEVTLRRHVPGHLRFVPVWARRAPDMDQVKAEGSSWAPLLQSVKRSDTRPEWRVHLEDALRFLLDLRSVQLDARCFPVTVSRQGDGSLRLSLDEKADRKRQFSNPLRALYFRHERVPMGRLFYSTDDETGKLQVLGARKNGSKDPKLASVVFLKDVLDDDNITVNVPNGERPLVDGRAWVRPYEDRGDVSQHRRQEEATEKLLHMGGLLQQLHAPRTLKGPTRRWQGAGGKLKGVGRQVVRDMLATEPFYALHGPPGTGKTTVTAAALAAMLREDPSARVLVSSQSHHALDNLGERVLKEVKGAMNRQGGGELVALRVASNEAVAKEKVGLTHLLLPKQTEARVKAIRQHIDRIVNDGHLPGGAPLTQALKALLVEWREQVERVGLELRDRLQRGANLVFATTGTCTDERLGLGEVGGLFDWVVIEEAGRAWPTELAMPLVAGRRWTLIGDHLQLPAYDEMTVQRVLKHCAGSTDEDLRQHAEHAGDYMAAFRLFGSLFDRRAERFKRQPTSRNLVEPLDELDLQFRMHPNIARVVSRAFYRERIDPKTGDRISPEGGWLRSDTSTQSRQHGLHAPGFVRDRALLWLDTEGCQDIDDQRTWKNPGEARVIATLLQRLRPAPAAHEEERFALLSPYLQQLEHLQNAGLPNWALPHIHSVDSFQGREADLVVVSLVRSLPRGRSLEDARPEMDVGYLVSPNRVNVLLSRARALLIIVGRFEHFHTLADRYPDRPDIGFWREVTQEVLDQEVRVSAKEALGGLEGPWPD